MNRPMLGGPITSDQFTHRQMMDDAAGEQVPMCTRCTRVRIDDAWLIPLPVVVAAFEGTVAFVHSICEACARAVQCPDIVSAPD
jgi:hypothetical protein